MTPSSAACRACGSPDVLPNDAQFEQTWGLHNTGQYYYGLSKPDADIDAPEAWDITKGSSDVVVGVIDTASTTPTRTWPGTSGRPPQASA